MGNYFVGIDIGGTYTRAVLLKGTKPQKTDVTKIKTAKSGKVAEKKVVNLIREISQGKSLSGIGVGVAGIVNRERGVFVANDNLPFSPGWNIKKALAGFKAPVMADNDARCFLLAECEWGAGRGFKNLIGMVIGTGIGGGIIINGKMIYGTHNSAGEVGHIVMDEKRGKFLDDLGAKKAFLKYGDRSRVIGMGIASLINILDPEIVVLGGGGVQSENFNLRRVRDITRKYTVSSAAAKTPIVKGELGDSAQAIGAALLFLK